MSEEDKNVTSLEDEVTVGKKLRKRNREKERLSNCYHYSCGSRYNRSFLDAEEGAPERQNNKLQRQQLVIRKKKKTYTEEQKTAFQNWYDQACRMKSPIMPQQNMKQLPTI